MVFLRFVLAFCASMVVWSWVHALSFAPGTQFLDIKTERECIAQWWTFTQWYGEIYCTKAWFVATTALDAKIDTVLDRMMDLMVAGSEVRAKTVLALLERYQTRFTAAWATQARNAYIADRLLSELKPMVACVFDAKWSYLTQVHECEDIDARSCRAIGWIFDECGSACRHSDSEVCTLQCVPYCSLINITPTVSVVTSPVVATGTLGQCLTNKWWTFYGTERCGHCKNQKTALGDMMKDVKYVDCDLNMTICNNAQIQGYPTRVGPDGSKHPWTQTLEQLKNISGC